jgi:hypothetical protein
MINLRGHHLLCLQGFQGYGYDEEFTKNMTEIHKKLMNDEESIHLVKGLDDLCRSCPNVVCNICINDKENEKILKMDKSVCTKVFKRHNKEEYNASELFNLVNDIFKTPNDIKDTCLNCKWYDVCLWAKSKK